jgi:formate-dependent nitrite reductase membrane component NrfD
MMSRGPKRGGRRGEQPVVPRAEVRTYYDRPILKPPPWKWMIPAYLFTGGVAGVSSLLAMGGRLTGNRRLARQSRLAALGAVSASTVFLVTDLGRPARFYNMLRVFKPTSPMNVGSWLLSGYGTAAALAAASDLTGMVPWLGGLADAAAATLAPGLATYTAVLLGNTAVPAWHEARRELPFVFAGGAAAGAGGLAVALAPPDAAGPARRALVGGTAVELAALALLRRRLGPDLAQVYQAGRAGTLEQASRWLGIAGAGTVAMAGRRRVPAIAGGVAAMAASALARFAVFEAGRASTLDPRYVAGPQRERLDARAGDPAGT